MGFKQIIPNSLDAVSDRDFLLDLHFACSTMAMHLSRLAEEIVLWSSSEFGFITLSDSFSTGSSIMPQKKNPDFAELIRGSRLAHGNLFSCWLPARACRWPTTRTCRRTKRALWTPPTRSPSASPLCPA